MENLQLEFDDPLDMQQLLENIKITESDIQDAIADWDKNNPELAGIMEVKQDDSTS